MYQNTQKLVKMAQVEAPSEFFPLRRFFSEKQNYFRFSYSEILQCSFYFVTSQK